MQTRPIHRFNVRVYGLLLNEKKQIMLIEEEEKGLWMRKFPGGGLEFGEGTIECLQREWLEETGMKIEVLSHFYTTDFFQPSFFNPNDQLISIYYLVKPIQNTLQPTNLQSGEIVHRVYFQDLLTLNPEELSFPVDKVVASLLRKQFLDLPS
ncbi:MAG: NUDIX domain-containing protein [Bacteroidia bacterium]|nr:NUDIX domain-containing protein [Bacteroidia bacterium]